MSASIEVYNPLTAYNGAISKLEKNGIRATKQRRVLAKLIFDKGLVIPIKFKVVVGHNEHHH